MAIGWDGMSGDVVQWDAVRRSGSKTSDGVSLRRRGVG